jgi:hypothetical protein
VAFGQSCRISAVGSVPPRPALGFTTTTRPSPSTSASSSWCSRADAGSVRPSGHQRLVSRATPTPIAVPAATSDGQCTPVCTREYATAAATGATAAASAGDSIASAVVNAAADAACPDGNDDDVGRLVSRRGTSSRSAAGRRRGNRRFATRLALKLAPPIAASPRSAARRVTPLRNASTPATTSHNTLWLAARDNSFIPSSTGEARNAPERLITARSRRFTRRSTQERYPRNRCDARLDH